MTTDEAMVLLGRATAMIAIGDLEDAVLGPCEAVDIVGEKDVRCGSTGVRIEKRFHGRLRERTVCPRHGYDPLHTPPVQAQPGGRPGKGR